MKKCPVCEKTFEDSMRFCQSDGTPLVEDEQPLDPYKTMVASASDIAAAMPPKNPPAESPIEKDEQVLELPAASDSLKTQYASEEEIRREMDKHPPADENVIEIPPLAPEPPKFIEPSLSPPSFGDISPPPSPFSSSEAVPKNNPPVKETPVDSPFEKTTPPIPSPFVNPKPAAFDPPAPNFPAFAEPEPAANLPSSNPFDQPPSVPVAAWTPPAPPDAGWQNQEIGQNTPFQPPVVGVNGPSSTLAIVSVALGVIAIVSSILTLLSIFCGIIPVGLGIGAIVTGFLGRSRAVSDPANYGGKGLAIGGIIAGALAIIATAVIAIVLTALLAILMGASQLG